jgi:hypothetical protein
LKQVIDERQQAVVRILAVVDDIIETAAVSDINETTVASK